MAVIRVPRKHVDVMIAHALADAPIECCGIVAAAEGVVTAIHRAANVEASPYRFSINPLEYRRIDDAIDAAGANVAGTYHSHTGSEAIVSPTDIRTLGGLWPPPYVHFVVGLKDPLVPVVRCWFIENGDKSEQEFEVFD